MSDESEKKTSELERAIAGLRAQGIDPASFVLSGKMLLEVPDAQFEMMLSAWEEWRARATTTSAAGYYEWSGQVVRDRVSGI